MDCELAYLAGFVDGEGCISIGRSKDWFHLVMVVNQINPAPLLLLHARFGGSIHPARKEGYRTAWTWSVAGRPAADAIEALRPFLVVKAAEADLAVEFQRHMETPTAKTSEARSEAIAYRAAAHAEAKALKHKAYDDFVPPPKAPRRRGFRTGRLWDHRLTGVEQ